MERNSQQSHWNQEQDKVIYSLHVYSYSSWGPSQNNKTPKRDQGDTSQIFFLWETENESEWERRWGRNGRSRGGETRIRMYCMESNLLSIKEKNILAILNCTSDQEGGCIKQIPTNYSNAVPLHHCMCIPKKWTNLKKNLNSQQYRSFTSSN